jgi:Fe-S-cluster containining protein
VLMACKDYENRPQLCRDFTCGKQHCEHCGQCCFNALLGLHFEEGADLGMNEDMMRFFDLHGIHRVPEGFFFECCCKNFIAGDGSG